MNINNCFICDNFTATRLYATEQSCDICIGKAAKLQFKGYSGLNLLRELGKQYGSEEAHTQVLQDANVASESMGMRSTGLFSFHPEIYGNVRKW